MNKNKGFTLVEIMMVLAIIGVMAGVAIPAYQDHVRRTEMAEGITIMSAISKRLVEQYVKTGVWPANNAEANFDVSKYNNDDFSFFVGPHYQVPGEVAVWFIVQDGKSYVAAFLSAEKVGPGIQWHCYPSVQTNARKHNKYLPADCRNRVR